jgi:hypothetical protein
MDKNCLLCGAGLDCEFENFNPKTDYQFCQSCLDFLTEIDCDLIQAAKSARKYFPYNDN